MVGESVWFGAWTGPRFGPKQFRAEVACDLSLRRLLGGVATALEQVVSGAAMNQPWRVTRGTSPTPGDGNGSRFSARGNYRWDNSPYVVHDTGGGLTTHYDITGRSQSGSGLVLLDALAVFHAADETHATLDLVFREISTPMWLKHESEELVASTVRGLAGPLAELLGAEVFWDFVEGDWLCNQVIDIPNEGVVRLTRRRG